MADETLINPTVLVGVVGAVVTLIGIIATYLATRGKSQSDAKTALDARIDARVEQQLATAWQEIDGLKKKVTALEQQEARKMSAVARILRTIAAQWPDSHGPDLDPADIAEIEDTIPPAWIRRPHSKEST